MEEKKSTFEPDFCAVKLSADPWIVQPFEIYEEIELNKLKKSIKNKKRATKSALFYYNDFMLPKN